MSSPITTHVLDISKGKPAAGVPVSLEKSEAGSNWKLIGKGSTDGDGRLKTLVSEGASLEAGIYRITFQTSAYFKKIGTDGFYPYVSIVFDIRSPGDHYHVPLLLSPYGYSTYRGS